MLQRIIIFSMLFLFSSQALPSLAQDAPAKDSAEEKPKPDPFAVPEGTDEKVLNLFMQRIARTPPTDRSREGILEHLGKMDVAINEILSREVTEELFVSAVELRLQILSILPQLGDNSGVIKRAKLLDELKLDKRKGVQDLTSRLELEERISRLPIMPEPAKLALINEVGEQLSKADIKDEQNFMQAAQNAMEISQSLERIGDTSNAVIAYKKYGSILEEKMHPDLGEAIERMQATVRRLELLGNKIEIAGPILGGGDFNITQLEGKVVLVDFWATWCGPCIAELPNVKELYEAYHEKGFEVIGISLDEDVETLKGFITSKDLKWATIFYPEPEEQGWDNPIARYYGISGIPTAILVNQEGKVVTLQARGENLRDELAKLLGPLPEKPKKTVE